jgi:hypothetical protein
MPQQLVSVFLNEIKLGDLQVPQEWTRHRLAIPEGVFREGENKLRVYFRHAGEIDGHPSAAEVRSVSVGGPGRPRCTVETIDHSGTALQALRCKRGARLSYYLLIPRKRPRLLLSSAGTGAGQIAVRGSKGYVVLKKLQAGESWQEESIDLSTYAGSLIRLDLWSEEARDWGRPHIVGAIDQTPRSTRADHVIVWHVAGLRHDRLGRSFELPEGFQQLGLTANVPLAGASHAASMASHFQVGTTLDARIRSLAGYFQSAGYSTALFSGNGFVSDASGLAAGFEHYENPMREHRGYGAEILWDSARRFLERRADRRTFTTIVTVEGHVPYRGESEPGGISAATTAQLSGSRARSAALGPAERSQIVALYDSALTRNSAALARAVRDIEELGLADRTALVVVGDHGEELFEEDRFGHGFSLIPAELDSAIALRWRDRLLHQGRGQSLDVLPTVLALAGIAAPREAQGVSLFEGNLIDTPHLVGLPDGARGMALGQRLLVRPANRPAAMVAGDLTSPIALRALRACLSYLVEFEASWPAQRWGHPLHLYANFARDQSL